MELSHLGVVVDILWHEIPNHSKYVELGDFVAMPNHIHGIMILDKPGGVDVNGSNVEKGHALSLLQTSDQTSQSPTKGQIRLQNIGKNTVSSIIGSYKSAVTKHANRWVGKWLAIPLP